MSRTDQGKEPDMEGTAGNGKTFVVTGCVIQTSIRYDIDSYARVYCDIQFDSGNAIAKLVEIPRMAKLGGLVELVIPLADKPEGKRA